MKIRNGFVSNSSSSSFIVIGNDILVEPKHEKILIVDKNLGTTEFGWNRHKIDDWGSRVIFAYLQSVQFSELDEKSFQAAGWLRMLEKVLTNHGFETIIWKVGPDSEDNWGYIDHQSSSEEGKNIEMFESEEKLERFLFAKDSYIMTDNDNY
jgi:hypothetical protein